MGGFSVEDVTVIHVETYRVEQVGEDAQLHLAFRSVADDDRTDATPSRCFILLDDRWVGAVEFVEDVHVRSVGTCRP